MSVTVRIATYNIQHGRHFPVAKQTGKETLRLDLFAALIRRYGIEICGLNEVYQDPTGYYGDQPAAIAASLGYHAAFAEGIRVGGTAPYGNAMLSAYPLLAVRKTPIRTDPATRRNAKGYEDRVLLETDIALGDRAVTVMTCHFGLHPDEQEAALEVVLRAVQSAGKPVVLMGDFNLTPDAAIVCRLKEVLTDALPAAGEPCLTFPSDQPEVKIDYLMVSREWTCRRALVPNEVVSDHLPLIAELELA